MNIRTEALLWWNQQEDWMKKSIIDTWKQVSDDPRTKWLFEMINYSSSCIETIYKNIVKK